MLLSKIMCWTTIMTEFSLFVGFAVRRFWPIAIWLGILFHTSMTVFTGITFVLFVYVAPAAYFAFVRWPESPTTVIYDGDCGICAKTKRLFEMLDFERAFEWKPFQSGVGERFGISTKALEERLHVVRRSERIEQGFAAFKLMLLFNPVTFFALLGILLLLHDGPSWARSLALVAMIGFFFPAFDRVGQRVYDLVARNRSRIGTDPTCAVD